MSAPGRSQARIPEGEARRNSDVRAGPLPNANPAARSAEGRPVSSGATPGSVSLVGAGPGDPDLLTVQAVKAIRQATMLLVDDLVGAGVLRYARRGARIVHVGKRGGCRSTPQSFIHELMVAEARRGETVVRLKGGDPFVFGRGGEEAEHLRAASIAVMPGSTRTSSARQAGGPASIASKTAEAIAKTPGSPEDTTTTRRPASASCSACVARSSSTRLSLACRARSARGSTRAT
jgi:siroheme synthase